MVLVTGPTDGSANNCCPFVNGGSIMRALSPSTHGSLEGVNGATFSVARASIITVVAASLEFSMLPLEVVLSVGHRAVIAVCR